MLSLIVQRIEAPVRGGEQAPGSIPDGGPPIRERESELDREIVASAGNRERDILNSGARILHPHACIYAVLAGTQWWPGCGSRSCFRLCTRICHVC